MKSSFINSRGIEIHCLPIGQEYLKLISDNVRASYIEREEPIEPPKRWIPKMGGGTMPEPLTNWIDPETGKVSDELTDEEKEKLAQHLDAMRRMEADRLLVLVNAHILEGINLSEVPLIWIKRQKLILNPIPVDQDELKLQYAKSELIVTFPWSGEDGAPGEGAEDSDFSQLSTICQALAFKGLSKEAEEQWRNRFRRRASGSGNGTGNAPGGALPGANGAVLGDEHGDVAGPDSGELRSAAELV